MVAKLIVPAPEFKSEFGTKIAVTEVEIQEQSTPTEVDCLCRLQSKLMSTKESRSF